MSWIRHLPLLQAQSSQVVGQQERYVYAQYSTRNYFSCSSQLLQIINGLSTAGLKIIGSDVVEFTPIYDNAAETTGIAISEIIYEILQWMIHVPVKKPTA
jgi:hypothetical protein